MSESDKTRDGSTNKNHKEKAPEDEQEVVKFSPEEEAKLLKESNSIKTEGNVLFSSKDYHNAIARYDDALATCPNYLHYERVVLQSNIAACHLRLEQWQDAIKAATDALSGLDKLQTEEIAGPASVSTKNSASQATKDSKKSPPEEEVEEEIISSEAARSAPAPPPDPSPEQVSAESRKADILRIRTKALLRRGRARSEAGGWSNLAGAEEDYRTLSQMPGLTPADMRNVRSQLKSLPPRTKAAQEAEMSEMWGKLRGLGDGILKPFGLSTDNFKMVKDEKTGGYSVNFSQGGEPSS